MDGRHGPGYVYVARILGWAGDIKIGLSIDPEGRMRDLSNQHSTHFELAYTREVKSMSRVEDRMHGTFARCQVRQHMGREFFRVDEKLAIDALNQIVDLETGTYNLDRIANTAVYALPKEPKRQGVAAQAMGIAQEIGPGGWKVIFFAIVVAAIFITGSTEWGRGDGSGHVGDQHHTDYSGEYENVAWRNCEVPVKKTVKAPVKKTATAIVERQVKAPLERWECERVGYSCDGSVYWYNYEGCVVYAKFSNGRERWKSSGGWVDKTPEGWRYKLRKSN